MRIRLLAAAALLTICLTPGVASADATLFLGRNSAGDDRAVARGFAVGVSLLVVGFEFEYANAGEDATLLRPSLRTTSGNVFAQTFGLPFQLYATTGAGMYRERLGGRSGDRVRAEQRRRREDQSRRARCGRASITGSSASGEIRSTRTCSGFIPGSIWHSEGEEARGHHPFPLVPFSVNAISSSPRRERG